MIYRIRLAIPREELLRYYRDWTQSVLATARTGQRIRFPAESLKPFVTRSGVFGDFELDVAPDQKLRGIRRIGPARRLER
jgi:hypothetical protein